MKDVIIRGIAAAIALALLAGCDDEPAAAGTAEHAAEPAPVAPTNRVDIPPPVRSNLGITFARVERRHVASTIRVPGRFELLPTARREHRTPMTGRIELLVGQYQAVEAGQALYRLDSPDWRDMQRELAETQTAIDIARARLASHGPLMEAHRLHEQGLREAVELWTARVQQLQELGAAGGGRAAELAEAQANLTTARASFGEVLEKDAELSLRRAETESERRSAEAKFDLLLTSAAALLGLPKEELRASPGEGAGVGSPWHEIGQVEVRAGMSGVVDRLALTSGAWAEAGELVLSVVDPAALRFRAVGLQSDLGRLRDGLPAAIAAPHVRTGAGTGTIATVLQIGLDADPEQRTIELLAVPSSRQDWTRPGVSAFLEIATDQTSAPELAVPMSAVVRDGLVPIVFRRDPSNPDRCIRLEADLGLSDGRWIVINSGVREGDEIVLDGVYQLLLATAASAQKGGHFHADGTFHEGGEE